MNRTWMSSRVLATALAAGVATGALAPLRAARTGGEEGGLVLLGVEGTRPPVSVGVPREVSMSARIPTAVALSLFIEELESMFVNDDTLLDLLARAEDREALARAYKERTGMELADALKRQMSGQDLRLALAMLGSKESILTEDLARRQLRDALASYRKGGGKLSDSSTVMESRDVLEFLSHHLTVTDKKLSDRFVTGTEYALKKKIQEESQRLGHRLTPGDVFRLSLELNGGDKFKAVMTAHTTLRALARGKSEGLQTQVPPELQYHAGRKATGDPFGAREDDDTIRNYLQPIRGGQDEGGAWYHFFGMAAFAMTAGETVAWGASFVEENYVSGDAKTDPLELYTDRLGADAGSSL